MLLRTALASIILGGIVSILHAEVAIEVQKPDKSPLKDAEVRITTVPDREPIEEGRTNKDGILKVAKLPGHYSKVYVTVYPKGEQGKDLQPKTEEHALNNVMKITIVLEKRPVPD